MDTDLIPVGRGASAHGTESGGEEEDDMMWDRDLDLPDTCVTLACLCAYTPVVSFSPYIFLIV